MRFEFNNNLIKSDKDTIELIEVNLVVGNYPSKSDLIKCIVNEDSSYEIIDASESMKGASYEDHVSILEELMSYYLPNDRVFIVVPTDNQLVIDYLINIQEYKKIIKEGSRQDFWDLVQNLSITHFPYVKGFHINSDGILSTIGVYDRLKTNYDRIMNSSTQ